MRNYSIKELVLKNKGHELDDYAQRILDVEKKWILLGTEKEIEDFYERLGKEINIYAVSVIGKKNDFTTYDYPIVSLEDIQVTDTMAIVCLTKDRKKYEQLLEYFENRNCIENINFFD